jgi:hypothetical protein
MAFQLDYSFGVASQVVDSQVISYMRCSTVVAACATITALDAEIAIRYAAVRASFGVE